MKFQLCENTGFSLRMGLIGPSGSGKTFTALRVATELGYEHIAVIDTENRSARRYARAFPRRFAALELDRFSPRDYIEALHAAEQQGVQVLIIDSLSHAWMGRGGVLEMVDQSAKRQAKGGAPSSFNGWREVTPEHNRLVEALVHAKLHLIVTMRVKTEYVIEKDQSGKSVPRKVGLAPVQREGLEYEFDIVGDLSPEHDLVITKSRCPELADRVIARPGAELARVLRAWLDGASSAGRDGGAELVAPEAPPPGHLTPEEDDAWRGSRCDGCRVPLVYLRTGTGKEMPTLPRRKDGKMTQAGEVWSSRLHLSHFIDCPAAAEHRLAAIRPWLLRIEVIAQEGTPAALAALRQQLNAARAELTSGQRTALRRALDAAAAAMAARAAAQPPPELRIERDLPMGTLPHDS